MKISRNNIPQSNRIGFTLIEILIVIAIMGVLATLVMGSYIGTLKKGRDSRRKADLTSISKALEMYYNDHDRYPPATNHKINNIEWGSVWQETINSQNVLYMSQIPKDPHRDSNGTTYYYDTDGNGTFYQLYTKLENKDDPQLFKTGATIRTYGGTDCDAVTAGSQGCSFGISSSNITVTDNSHSLVP